ncbi:hypothetical protein K4E_03340 [Enterococcus thailandicus]|nr:hypothetical protein K4E_03340 [Enterococcus thailandicus]
MKIKKKKLKKLLAQCMVASIATSTMTSIVSPVSVMAEEQETSSSISSESSSLRKEDPLDKITGGNVTAMSETAENQVEEAQSTEEKTTETSEHISTVETSNESTADVSGNLEKDKTKVEETSESETKNSDKKTKSSSFESSTKDLDLSGYTDLTIQTVEGREWVYCSNLRIGLTLGGFLELDAMSNAVTIEAEQVSAFIDEILTSDSSDERLLAIAAKLRGQMSLIVDLTNSPNLKKFTMWDFLGSTLTNNWQSIINYLSISGNSNQEIYLNAVSPEESILIREIHVTTPIKSLSIEGRGNYLKTVSVKDLEKLGLSMDAGTIPTEIYYGGNPSKFIENLNKGNYLWQGNLTLQSPLTGDNFIGIPDKASIDSIFDYRTLTLTNDGNLDVYATKELNYLRLKGVGTTKFLKGNDSWSWLSRIIIEQKSFSIAEKTFKDLHKLNSIDLLGDTKCTEIGASAFESTSLREMTAGQINRLISGLEVLGQRAFYDCSITGEISSKTLKTLNSSVFQGNKITSVDFPELRTAFGQDFQDNQITNFKLPKLEYMGTNTFANNSLTSLDIPKELPNVQQIAKEVFRSNKLVDVVLPDSSVKFDVGTGLTVFDGNSETLKQVTVPYERLASGEISAVTGFPTAELKAIKKLVVTDGETIDKANVVAELTNLEELHLPQTKVVGENAFSNHTTLKALKGVQNIEKIEANAFSNCAIEGELSLDKLISIGDSGFENNKIAQFNAPNLESLGSAALSSNNLSEVKFDSLKTCTGKDQLANNQISKYSVKSLEVVPEGFMYNNKVTSVDLQADFPKLKKIGRWAFAQNALIKKVVLPKDSVEVSLANGESIFTDSPKIEEVIAPYERFANDDAKGKFKSYIPKSLNTVSTLTLTGQDANNRKLITAELTQLNALHLPETTIVGDEAFADQGTLQNVDAPNAEVIGVSAFRDANLSSENYFDGKFEHETAPSIKPSLYLPKVKQIKESAFSGANPGFRGVGLIAEWGHDFPMLEEIGENAFEGWNIGVIRAPKLKTFTPQAFINTAGVGLLLVSTQNADSIKQSIQDQVEYDDDNGSGQLVKHHINALALPTAELTSGLKDKWTQEVIHYGVLGKLAINEGDEQNQDEYYWFGEQLEVKNGNQSVAMSDIDGNLSLEGKTAGTYSLYLTVSNRNGETANVNLGKFTLNEGVRPVVQPTDLGNQQWLIDAVNKALGKTVGKDVTFEDLEKVTSLRDQISFSNNSIIPKEIELLSNLEEFDFSFNPGSGNIGGEIPNEFWNLPLKSVKIYGGEFVGAIPKDVMENNNLNLTIVNTQLTYNQEKLIFAGNRKFSGNFVPGATNEIKLSGKSKIQYSDDELKIYPFLATDETSFDLTALDSNNTKSELYQNHTYKIVDTSDNSVVYEGPWDTNVAFEGKDTTYKVILDGAELNPNNVFEVKAEKLSNAVHSEFKLGYWRDYGFVLEGSASQDNKTYTQKDVTKKIEIVDVNNQVVQSFDAANTNWYDTANYTGYQSILTKKQLKTIPAGSYKVQVHVTTNDNDFTLPVQEKAISTTSYIGDYQKQISQIPMDTADQTEISFQSVSGQMQMTIAKNESTVNKISSYKKGNNKILDAWLATDAFDFQQEHTKELVVEDNSGKEISRKTISTWDISKTFGISVKNEWKKSGFQLVLTPDDQKAGNKTFVAVKDKDGNEKLKVEIK